MTQYVRILDGTFSDEPVRNVVFPLVQDIRNGKYGSFIKVDGTSVSGYPSRNIKIFVTADDFQYVESSEVATPDVVESMSDEEIIQEQDRMFEDLAELTFATCSGAIRSMIVSGDAGLGKSYTVEEVLNETEELNMSDGTNFEVLKGDISPIHLFMKLWDYRGKGQVLVLDDCDEILFDGAALNMLKAALDTSPKRWISYNKESKILEEAEIPNRFKYEGSVIFITNLDFEAKIEKGTSKNSPHYAALISRSHYVNVHLKTKREKWLRMKNVAEKGMLNDLNLNEEQQVEVMGFVETNFDKLRETSLRTVIKVAQLHASSPKRWEQLATTSILKKY